MAKASAKSHSQSHHRGHHHRRHKEREGRGSQVMETESNQGSVGSETSFVRVKVCQRWVEIEMG